MPRHQKDPREVAARALCEFHGNPPNIPFEGKPMWMSYLPEVMAVLKAIGFDDGKLDTSAVKPARHPE